ncbi:hypothetical protein CMV30_17135 [Nibricoccus aquaticus]|uniref:Uncharacterized protein n=1 Tax=Nibricoccus aquaticus TaxID=2576891 RepID=A0A290QAR9_9BACT|nr:hypothetical protein [Nibricoccus aquaticus]ATC65533.1 hypothetical protein CMV30_17135 [Nibricoccus aquaticus]
MPPRSPQLPAPLSTEDCESRKKFLALACACDRVELALAWKKPARPQTALGGLVSGPWVPLALSALTPLLPRKLRAAAFLFRLWKSSR